MPPLEQLNNEYPVCFKGCYVSHVGNKTRTKAGKKA